MQIVEGAYYKRRDGEVVGPAEPNQHKTARYPWNIPLNGGFWGYTDNGESCLSDRNDDIIERVNPDGTPYKEKSMTSKTCVTAEDPIEMGAAGVVLGAAYQDGHEKLYGFDSGGKPMACYSGADVFSSPLVKPLLARLRTECKPLVKLPMTVEQFVKIARVYFGYMQEPIGNSHKSAMLDALAAEGFEVTG